MADLYQYGPLPNERSIRVLLLDPGTADEPLSGTLKVIHLSRRVEEVVSSLWGKVRPRKSSTAKVYKYKAEIPYEAISYVWGSDVKDHTILLDGKTHPITAKLSESLYQCRWEHEARPLWADSICINQGDLEEKSQQVFMMDRIYASCQRTVICLGIDPDHQSHAREAFGVISDVSQMMDKVFQDPDFCWKPNSFPWPATDDPLIRDPRWQSVAFLIKLPWFGRGWVVQEAALGPDVRMLWSGAEMPFMDLARAESWYNLRAFSHSSAATGLALVTPTLFRQPFYHDRKAETVALYVDSQELVKGPEILLALNQSRDLGLYDPRDRIYALLSLPFIRNPMPPFRPDYRKPYLELYRDFAIQYLEQTSNLSLLCQVLHDEESQEPLHSDLASSWAPRWNSRKRGVLHGGYWDSGKFGQASAEPAKFEISRGGDGAPASLQVSAVVFYPITQISPRFEENMPIDDFFTFWADWSRKASSATGTGPDEPIPDFHSKALVMALSVGRWTGTSYEEWMGRTKSFASFLQKSTAGSDSSEWAELTPDLEFFFRHVMRVANYSHVFLLGNGYYGMGPLAAREGDICALVFGVALPLILRKVPGAEDHQYNVIGPAILVCPTPDGWGLPTFLHQFGVWSDWDQLCQFPGWNDCGLKKEQIILL